MCSFETIFSSLPKPPRSVSLILFSVLMIADPSSAEPWAKHGEAYAPDLDKIVKKYDVRDAKIVFAVGHLSLYGISYGLEVLDLEKPLITLSLNNVPVRQILDEIVSQCPGYKWEETRGIIHIYPERKLKEKSPLAFLDRKISSFESSGLDVARTIGYLSDRAETAGVDLVINMVRYSTETIQERADFTPADARISISLKTPTTLREALDRIIRLDAPAFWRAIPKRDGRLSIAGAASHAHTEESAANKRRNEERERLAEEIRSKQKRRVEPKKPKEKNSPGP